MTSQKNSLYEHGACPGCKAEDNFEGEVLLGICGVCELCCTCPIFTGKRRVKKPIEIKSCDHICFANDREYFYDYYLEGIYSAPTTATLDRYNKKRQGAKYECGTRDVEKLLISLGITIEPETDSVPSIN
jgi:hypothetical protein